MHLTFLIILDKIIKILLWGKALIMDEVYPFHVQLHLTNRCNLKCRHCYEGARSSINEWSFEELTRVIDQLDLTFSKWEVDGEISLVGGEPVLWPYLSDLLYYLRKTQTISRIAILTNGIFLPEELKKAILDTRPAIQISIDGTTAEKHDFIRGQGSYQKSIQTIKWLVANEIDVFVHYVISRYTIPVTREFVHYMNELGVKQLTFSRVVPMGCSDTSIMLSKEELHNTFKLLNQYRNELPRNGMSINSARPLWACFGESGRCPVGIQTITILHDGTVYPCRRLPIALGNIKEESLFSIWYKSDVLWNLRQRKQLKKCGSCDFLEDCGGARCIAFAVTQDYMEEDPQCWR